MTTQECVIKLIEELVGTLPDMDIYDSYESYLSECYKIIIKNKPGNSIIMWIYYDEICIRRHNETSYELWPTIEFCDPNLIEKIANELTHN